MSRGADPKTVDEALEQMRECAFGFCEAERARRQLYGDQGHSIGYGARDELQRLFALYVDDWRGYVVAACTPALENARSAGEPIELPVELVPRPHLELVEEVAS
jgi:hypothetical protein